MSQQLEDAIYDDDAAVKFIQNNLPQEFKGKFSDDDVLYITDVVFDFYDSNGLMEDDSDVDIEIEELVDYVMKNAKRDGFVFDREGVRWVIEGEFDYEETIG